MPRSTTDDEPGGQLKVIVTCDDAFVSDAAARKQVLAELKAKGLTQSNVLEKIGIVTGRIRADQLSALASVQHVVGVERDHPRSAI